MAVYLCSWLHPCPFLGISSPWQEQPLQCLQDSRCQSIRHPEPQRALSSDPAPRLAPPPASLSLPSASSLAGRPHPEPSALFRCRGPVGGKLACLLGGLPRWREGDRVCWGRGVHFCVASHTCGPETPCVDSASGTRRPPSLPGSCSPAPSSAFGSGDVNPAAHPAPESSVRAPYRPPAAACFPPRVCGSTCLVELLAFRQAVTFSRGSRREPGKGFQRSAALPPRLSSSLREGPVHPANAVLPIYSHRPHNAGRHLLELRVSRAQEGE